MFRTLVGAMLVGGAALAQQGLIVEPWRKAPVPAAAQVPPLRAMPASGLGQVSVAPRPERKAQSAASSSSVPAARWSPPVVALLVDPWGKAQVAAPARARWVPSHVEIVDPWADGAAAAPRVANHQAGPSHSTIF